MSFSGRAHRLCALAVSLLLLIAIIPAFLPSSSEDSPSENVFMHTPTGSMPPGIFSDIAYSGGGEWVVASSGGLYYYNNQTSLYNDAWRLEIVGPFMRGVETTPWGIAAVGDVSEGGLMVVERDNYAHGTTVMEGDRDIGRFVDDNSGDIYGMTHPDGLEETTIFFEGFEDTSQEDYWDGDGVFFSTAKPYTGDYSLNFTASGTGPANSAFTNPDIGNNSTFFSGYHQEKVTWAASYNGLVDSVVFNISTETVLNIDRGEVYETIQGAVDSADSGDTIMVFPGTYYENVSISKPITLWGFDRDTTIINNSVGGGYGIRIDSTNDVTVTDLTVQVGSGDDAVQVNSSSNCRIENLMIGESYTGIILSGGNGNILHKNILFNNSYGINVHQSYSNTISRNNLSSNILVGISIDRGSGNSIVENTLQENEDGIRFFDTEANTLAHNTITNNMQFGIYMEWGSSNNTIENNTVSYNNCGIYFSDANSNDVFRNTFSWSNWINIYLASGTYGNLLFVNNLLGNTGTQAEDHGPNTWNLEKNQGGGNHWSDHTSPDGGDGFVDSNPRIITGIGAQDTYPWVHEDGWVGNITVPQGGSIQGALQDARPLWTVYVEEGHYSENIQISKRLHLIGSGIDKTIIENSASTVVDVAASNVTMTGFTVVGVGSNRGIDLVGVRDCRIEYNSITYAGEGISILDSQSNGIEGNELEFNGHGVKISSSVGLSRWNHIVDNRIYNNNNNGVFITGSEENFVGGNTIYGNGWNGVVLEGCQNNHIFANEIYEHSAYSGIFLSQSSGNIIFMNTIFENSENMYFYQWSQHNTIHDNDLLYPNMWNVLMGDSSDNTFFRNNFFSPYAGQMNLFNSINTWHLDNPIGGGSGGNFWRDYDGGDRGDGIGDTSYVIDASNVDNFPWVYFTGWEGGNRVRNIDTGEYNGTIQGAVDNAEPGHTLQVYHGVYHEDVVINKQLTIYGAGAGETIIQGTGTNHAVFITSSSVTFSGFSVTSGNENENAMYIEDVDNCLIENNTMHNSLRGIYAFSGGSHTLRDNYIYSTEDGIHIRANSIVLERNRIHSSNIGINLYMYGGHTAKMNTISDSGPYGIYIQGSNNNHVYWNTISNSSTWGVFISGSSDNYIYQNNFLYNSYANAGEDPANNFWNVSYYEGGGNYWSDHTGLDDFSGENQDISGADGIIDTPKVNILHHNSVDEYPWLEPNRWYEIDYIQIVDTPSAGTSKYADMDIPMDVYVEGYAAGFNNSFGYLHDIEATWTVTSETGGSSFAQLEISTLGYTGVWLRYARSTSISNGTFASEYSVNWGAWETLETATGEQGYTTKDFGLTGADDADNLRIRWHLDAGEEDNAWLDDVEVRGTMTYGYSQGSHVYLMSALDNQVTEGMVRVTPVSNSSGWYPSNSTVAPGDKDIAEPITLLETSRMLMASWGDTGAGWTHAYADDLYWDADGDGNISVGDIRITHVKTYDFDVGEQVGAHSSLASLAVSQEHGILAVGDKGAMTLYYNDNIHGWTFKNASHAMISQGYDLYDVTYTNGVWVVVGRNRNTMMPAAFALSGNLLYCEEISLDSGDSRDLLAAAGYDGLVLMVGGSGRVVVYNTATKVASPRDIDTVSTLYDVAWKWDGSEAIICSEGGYPLIYVREGGRFVEVSHGYGNDPLYHVGVKPPSSPGYALILRGGGSILGYSFDTAIQIPLTGDAAHPHISDFDILVGSESRKKGMVDVGSTLTFYIDAYFAGGWENVDIWLEGWYDEGLEGANSNPPGVPGRDDRNTYFNLSYNSSGWVLNFPSGPAYDGWNSEFKLDSWSETSAVEADGYEHHYLGVNLTLGSQVRAARPDGVFNPGNETNQTEGFNNSNTWDVRLQMSAGTASTYRYTEFGVYRYIRVSSTGSPAGSAAPGQEVVMHPKTTLNIMANTPYYATVEATNLYNHTGEESIGAENLYVQNHQGMRNDGSIWISHGDIASKINFVGPNQPLMVWGDPAVLSPSPNYGNTALGEYPGGALANQTTVTLGDPDMGLSLTQLENAWVTNPGGIYEIGDRAYIDADGSGDVSIGDIRIFHPTLTGLKVEAGDSDIGTPLYSWADAYVTGPDGRWDPATETVYHSLGMVDAGNIRVTAFHGFTVIDWWISIPPATPEGRYTGTATIKIYHGG